MKQVGEKYLGKNYDSYFEWSDERIYCSELVWKIYNKAFGIELGTPEKLGDFNLDNEIVADKLRERYGDNIPKEEIVISPAEIFNSKLLQTVYQN